MRKSELVLIPSPGIGHLISTVELAKLIIRRHERVSILVLIINHPMFSSTINAYIDSQTLDADPTRLTLLTLPSLSDPPDPKMFQALVDLHKPLVKQAVEIRIASGSPKPVGFVLDMLCTAMIDVGNELQIPSYIYFTTGTPFLNLMFYFQSLADEKAVDVPTRCCDPGSEFIVPGFKYPVPTKVLPWVFLDREACAIFQNHAKRFRECRGILVNTFQELETYGIQSLWDQGQDKILPRVYPVGPIINLDDQSPNGSHKKDREDLILRWLDDQPTSSVVFLCFGSMGCFGEDQVKEMANGLDRSGHRFLWSLRCPPQEGKFGPPSENETFVDALPEGFLGRTTHRGKIIGWAPQVSILAHRAIGGFISHCGWNSILESLFFGVPIATWPVYSEQQINAFALVKELGLAADIRMDYRVNWRTSKAEFIVTAEVIENGVKRLMNMDEEVRGKVREMGEKSINALRHEGSSNRWLNLFIQDVLKGTD